MGASSLDFDVREASSGCEQGLDPAWLQAAASPCLSACLAAVLWGHLGALLGAAVQALEVCQSDLVFGHQVLDVFDDGGFLLVRDCSQLFFDFGCFLLQLHLPGLDCLDLFTCQNAHGLPLND